MKTSSGFRHSFVICAAIFLIGAYSFFSVTVLADKAGEAAKKAADAVALAEKLAKECEDLHFKADVAEENAAVAEREAETAEDAAAKAKADAAEAMEKVGAKETPQDVAADKAAAAADAAAKDPNDKLGLKSGKAEAAAKKADDAAAKADENSDLEVRLKKQDARDKRKVARDKGKEARKLRAAANAALEAAKKKCDDAKAALEAAKAAIKAAEEALASKGGKDTGDVKEKLEGLNERVKKLVEAPKPYTIMPPSAGQGAETKTADGLRTVTFDTNNGRLIVNLPDDMRAGDTISGTVIAEPKGETKDDHYKNLRMLAGYVIALNPVVPTPRDKTISQVTFVIDTNSSAPTPITFTVPAQPSLGLFMMPNANSPVMRNASSGALQCINESCSPISQLIFFTFTSEHNEVMLGEVLAQAGHPIMIPGKFDGNSSNTSVSWQPAPPVNVTTPSSNQGTPLVVLAESENKVILSGLTNVTGPMQITVNEGGKQTTLPFRNVGVNLTAPKTNLLRGEQTTLKVEVSGLEGIKSPVPLTLTSTGVITMEGGNYQPLMIQPSQVGSDGHYTTTRSITGVQAGGWSATATVVTQKFNACLQDDTDPAKRLMWNTVTGDYSFTCPGCSPSGGQAGGSSSQLTDQTNTGKGTITTKGSVVTLEHNETGRSVISRIDQSTKTGSASVQTSSPKVRFTITDRNIANNTCPSR